MPNTATPLLTAARELSSHLERLKFSPPVTHVYNPLTYAWAAHEQYLTRYGAAPKRVIFLGMNPGPFGMVQTGIPFGEVPAVRDWLGIHTKIGKPEKEHPKRPVTGFACTRSEVSGRRLWGLFKNRFGTPGKFFQEHFVVNYCPLAFCSETGSNLTPDKLPKREIEPVLELCDTHLRRVVEILKPDWLIGIGGFAYQCAERIIESSEPSLAADHPKSKNTPSLTLAGPTLSAARSGGEGRGEVARPRTLAAVQSQPRLGQILHPSPASPAANRGDWGQTATKQLIQQGVWK